MMNTTACNPMIENYFAELERKMADLPAGDRREFSRELRAHVFDRLEEVAAPTESDCRSVLLALGSPEEIARQYRLERIMKRSPWKISPLTILRTTLRWALTGFQGFAVFMVAFVGYLLALCFYISALLKPFFPQNVGFHLNDHGFTIAAWPAPHGPALLDSYFIAICVVVGYLLTLGTTVLIRFLVRRVRVLKQKI